MAWFIKTETFRRPAGELQEALAAHRCWVEGLRASGVNICSGYRVDSDGRPGGGGLLLLQASDHASAEALVRQDPMLLSGGVDWQLHRWIAVSGDLALT